jgi:hypothetical protein
MTETDSVSEILCLKTESEETDSVHDKNHAYCLELCLNSPHSVVLISYLAYFLKSNVVDCHLYRISPNIGRGFSVRYEYCFLEKRGGLIFGSLRINMKKMIMRSFNC